MGVHSLGVGRSFSNRSISSSYGGQRSERIKGETYHFTNDTGDLNQVILVHEAVEEIPMRGKFVLPAIL
jgi:hypothetical protein